MINNINFDFSTVETAPLIVALTTTSLAFLLGASLSLWLTNKFWGRGAFHRLSLDSEQNRESGFVAVDLRNELIDREGTAVTDLRPSGKIMIDDQVYDAIALIGLIDKNTKVRVTKQESAQLYVMKA